MRSEIHILDECTALARMKLRYLISLYCLTLKNNANIKTNLVDSGQSRINMQQLTLMVFSFLLKNVHFISKNAISCLFLKNVSPPKRIICFNLNNLHFPMVEGIAFYALHKSRVLIIPCKADGFCLFIRLPDEI